MKVFLIRHGETTGDLEDRYGGMYDDHLTVHGNEQIQATAQRLVGKGIEAIFSSTLLRAKEAAEIIGTAINCSIEYTDGVRERNYGILTGLTKAEALQKYPDTVALHMDPKNTDPEGESYNDFNARIVESFKLITQSAHGTIAIVTHGGPIKCIYRYLGKGELGQLADGEILEIDVV